MQAGGATMILTAQPPPPSMAATNSLSVVGGIASSGQSIRPLSSMTQTPPHSTGLCYHQHQQPVASAIHTDASPQPMLHQLQQQQQQTTMISRPSLSLISSTSAVPHHPPTSAVSAVTEMLKRKLQQRLLAETAKKRCQLIEGAAVIAADARQPSPVDVSRRTAQTDFGGSGRAGSESVSVTFSSMDGAAVLTPHESVSNHLTPQQNALENHHPNSAQRPSFRSSLSAVSQSSTVQNTSSAQPSFPCVLPLAVGVLPARKQKKKFKRKISAAKDKAKTNSTVGVTSGTGSTFPLPNQPTTVSGALFAGSCAPILTLPPITQPTQAATTSAVSAAAMAAAVFGCRKLCGTSVGNGTVNPMMFVGSSGITSAFSSTPRCPSQHHQMSRPMILCNLNGSTSIAAQPMLGIPGNASKPSLPTSTLVSSAGWNSSGHSDSTLPTNQSRTSDVLTGSVPSKMVTSTVGAAEHQLQLQRLVNDATSQISTSGCETLIGLSVSHSASGRSPFHIRSSGSDVSVSGSPARPAEVTTAINVSGVNGAATAGANKIRKTAATIGLVTASLTGARIGTVPSTSTISPLLTSQMSATSAASSSLTSTLASNKTPNKIIKFHEYKGPPGMTSSSSSTPSTMTSSPASSSLMSISSISWSGNNVTLGMPLMSPDASCQQQPRLPLPPMQFLVPSFSASSSPSNAARVLRFDGGNSPHPTIGTPFTSIATTSVRPLMMTSTGQPRDAFPVGVLVTQPTTMTSSPVDIRLRVGNRPNLPNELSNVTDSLSLTSSGNLLPVEPELLPVYQASPTTQLPHTVVGWNSPRCALADYKKPEIVNAVTMSSMSGPNIVASSVSSVVSGLRLASSPNACLRLLPQDGRGSEFPVRDKRLTTNCLSTSDVTISRQPSVAVASLSSPVNVKSHTRASEHPAKITTSGANSPSAVPAHLEDVRVADLKAECRKRCLAVSGPKPNLIARLRPFAEEILLRLADVTVASSPATRQLLTSENLHNKEQDIDRSPEIALGVPPPVSGAVPDASFHPLMDCSPNSFTVRSRPCSAIATNQLQSPIKALFSPTRQVSRMSMSSPVRIENVFAASSSSSVVPSMFKLSSPSSRASSITSPAVDAGAVSPLVRRLFQTQVSVFQPSIAANAAASIAAGGLLSGTGLRSASDIGSVPCRPSASSAFPYGDRSKIASLLCDSDSTQPLVGLSESSHIDGDSNGDFFHPNDSSFRNTVEGLSGTSGYTQDKSQGISFDLSSMFRSSNTTSSSSSVDAAQFDMIDDVDDVLQQEFDAIGAEYLADDDDEATSGANMAVNDLGEYLIGPNSDAIGMASSSLSTASLGAPNAATMSPEELLDWQRRQIRELQSLLEKSRMELMETQVKVQRKSLVENGCNGQPEMAVPQSSVKAFPNEDCVLSAPPDGNSSTDEDVASLPSSNILSPHSSDVTNGSSSSPCRSPPSLGCNVKSETGESFFVPVVPMREPPKYDDFIRSKQHNAVSVSTFAPEAPPPKTAIDQNEAVVGSVEDLLDFLTSQRVEEDPNSSASSDAGQHVDRRLLLDRNYQQHIEYYYQHTQNQSNCRSSISIEHNLKTVVIPSPLSAASIITAATPYSSSYTSSAASMSYSPSSAGSSSAADYDTYLQQSSDSGNGSCTSGGGGGGAPWSVAPSSVDADEFMADHFSSSSSVGCAGDVSSGGHPYGKNCGGDGKADDRDWVTGSGNFGESDITDYQFTAVRPIKTEPHDINGGDRKSLSSTYGCSDPCLSSGAVADHNEDDEEKTEGGGSADEDNNGNDGMIVDDDCLDFTDLLDIIMPPPAVSSASRNGFSMSGMGGETMLSPFGRLSRSSPSSTSTRNVIEDLFEFDVTGDTMEAFGGGVQLSGCDGHSTVMVADGVSCPFEKVLQEAIASNS